MTAAATGQLRWHRAFPFQAVRRLGWFAVAGTALTAAMWVMFGAEPDRLASGGANPLAAVPAASGLAMGLMAGPLLLALARRPVVAADHFALVIRPGVVRTLVLPWAQVAEIAGVPVRGRPVLLVRCTEQRHGPGDRPRWWDQAVLRAARRGAGDHRGAVGAFHLAVRMDEFTGSPPDQLAALAAWAPRHVRVTRAP